MTNSFPLGMQVQAESDLAALVLEQVVLVSEQVAMAEPVERVGLEPVAGSMSGRATPHRPEDIGSHWQGLLPNIWHMHLFWFWRTAGMARMGL